MSVLPGEGCVLVTPQLAIYSAVNSRDAEKREVKVKQPLISEREHTSWWAVLLRYFWKRKQTWVWYCIFEIPPHNPSTRKNEAERLLWALPGQPGMDPRVRPCRGVRGRHQKLLYTGHIGGNITETPCWTIHFADPLQKSWRSFVLSY